MDEELNIDYKVLLEKSDLAENYCADLRKNMGYLYDTINKLNGGWEAPSKEVFIAAFKKDFRKLEIMAENVMKMSDCLRFAIDEYQKAEKQVSNFIEGMS